MSILRDDAYLSNDSFRPEFSQRPAGYQTPPPPIHYVEPISLAQPRQLHRVRTLLSPPRKRSHHEMGLQGHVVAGRDVNLRERYRSAGDTERRRQPSPKSESTEKQHSQEGPTPLDVFATVATSPSIGAGSPENFSNGSVDVAKASALLQKDGSRWTGNAERPAKRSRSEAVEQRPFADTFSRPSTSHIPQSHQPYGSHASQDLRNGVHEAAYPPSDNTMQDAELLLLFSRGRDEGSRSKKYGHQVNGLGINVFSAQHTHRAFPSEERTHGLVGNSTVAKRGHLGAANESGIWRQDGLVGGHYLGGSSVQARSDRGAQQDYVDAESQPQQKPKGRGGKGWPKGKPRGPRQYKPDKPKPSRSRTNRKPTSRKAKRDVGMAGELGDAQNPMANGDVGFGLSEFLLDGASAARPRRKSVTDVESLLSHPAQLHSTLAHMARPSSAPPSSVAAGDSRMNHLTGTIMYRPNTKKRKAAETSVCGACNSTKASPAGINDFWINCNGCKSWFHHTCVGFKSEREVRDVDKYHCPSCEVEHGKTTYVRKSSRAHASVDYAGLNEGTYRTSTDITDHHYIGPIKRGEITFQPETFPRMRPELVTAEYFEKCVPLAEPIVIPAAWNPRPTLPGHGSSGNAAASGDEHGDVSHHENDAKDSSGHDRNDDDDAGIDKDPLAEGNFSSDYNYDCVRDNGQDKLDMIIPQGLTVRMVTDMYGPDEKVDVIDVKSQEGEEKRWTMRQWADYYEAEGEKPVRNVISLEVSHSKLGRLIQRPKVVRDLDLQDAVWPREELLKGSFPRIQFYCLMSVADCYTDFHIDFGGSSVYYHIVKGKKTFFFIPPKKQHLKKYEEWCLSSNQGTVFLGNETKECYRVDLSEGDTMLIPSGWIHAVWTPENSLVIGGNFLTRMHYGMQIQINDIEKTTGVARKFRYPLFQKVLWCTVIEYLRDDPIPLAVAQKLLEGEVFERSFPVYLEFDEDEDAHEVVGPEMFNARYYSQGEIDGVADLLRFVLRTVLIALGRIPGVAKATQDAVIRSMPKGYGTHLDLARTFAMWIAWKRGNEQIPSWAYPNADLSEIEAAMTEKKPTTATKKKTEKQPAIEGERRSSRQVVKDQAKETSAESIVDEQVKTENALTESSLEPKPFELGKLFGVYVTVDEQATADEPSEDTEMTEAAGDDSIQFDENGNDTTLNFDAQPTPGSGRQTLLAVVIDQEERKHPFDDVKPPVSPLTPLAPSDAENTSATKRARAKACSDCRKSKRRCIHDENGQVDPIKLQELAERRGSSTSKRSKGTPNASTPNSSHNGSPINQSSNPGRLLDGTSSGLQDDVDEIVSKNTQFTAQMGSDSRPQADQTGEASSTDAPSRHPENIEPSATERPATQRIPSHASHDSVEARQKPYNDSSENRSRTPSLHMNTNSTKSAETPSSPRSSPLTDPEPTSPAPDQVTDASKIAAETPQALRATPRNRKQIDRFSSGSYSTQKAATEPRKPNSSSSFRKASSSATPAPATKSTSTSKDRRRSSTAAASAGGSPVFASRVQVVAGMGHVEDDPDEVYARQLAEQEFGLRRRKT